MLTALHSLPILCACVKRFVSLLPDRENKQSLTNKQIHKLFAYSIRYLCRRVSLTTSSLCHPSFKVEPCAGAIVSAPTRRSILVGGTGAPPVPKSGGGAAREANKFLLRFRKKFRSIVKIF